MTMDPKCSQSARQSRKVPAPIQVTMTRVANIQTPVRSYLGCTSQQHAPVGKAKTYSPPPGRFILAQSNALTASEVFVQEPARAYNSHRAQKHDLAAKAKQNSPPPTPPPRRFNLAESKARDEAAAAERLCSARTYEQNSLPRQYDDTRIFRWLENLPEYSKDLVGGLA